MPDSPTPEQLDRRAELLARCGPDEAAELAELTDSLRRALRGERLHVRRLSPDQDRALIDRLAAAEPVHPFRGPDDVADRLADDRRCFVLEHESLADRPLNVVWVALWRGVPHDLAAVLDPGAPTEDPAAADTAVFYSIWNVEPGLVGLPGGRSLLIGAMAALRDELAGLSTFVTLSPIPGLRRWLEADAAAPSPPEEEPSPPEAAQLSEQELLRACAGYLTSLRDDGRPLDAVARFHLGNGARLLSICAGADRSERGMDRSFGLMANYRYEPEDRDANRTALAAGEVVVGEQVAALLD